MPPVAPTAANLTALALAIGQGVRSVRYSDRLVTYNSTDEMLVAYNFLYSLVYPAGTPGPTGQVTRRQTRFITSTGW